MRILADRKIKTLFCEISLCVALVAFAFPILTEVAFKNPALAIFLCALCMAAAILLFCYRYCKERHEMVENAVAQITAYLSGNHDARIACNDEGEIYRLFHEVNALVSVLNAHLENEVRAKEFLKNTIADISHQLKTPLAALNIYNGILQGEAEDAATIHAFAALSEQELDRIETLVQNLLKITKLDAGAIVIEKSEESVSDMMDGIERQFSFRTAQEEKKLILLGGDDVTLSCDRNWLTEAMGNIVKNALDHTQKGDEIHIEWTRSAAAVQVVIRDNGSGIHPEDLYHIFKGFYRSRFSDDTQGVGLGLPLAKAIVEAHNGTIAVDSELGVGTAFTIHFLIPTEF